MLIKVLIVAVLIAIVASLSSGLFHLVKDEGQSKRMVNALTVRIALSVNAKRRLSGDQDGTLIVP